MASVVEALLDNAYQDSQLLEVNDQKGDIFSTPRDVKFILYAKDKAKSELVSNFINDNCYGDASFSEHEGKFCIIVVVHMPINQNILNSISGLMTCIVSIYDLDYDGWGCELQRIT